jgi:hypothetical protein
VLVRIRTMRKIKQVQGRKKNDDRRGATLNEMYEVPLIMWHLSRVRREPCG